MHPKPFFPIALQLEGRECLVIGAKQDDEVRARIRSLEECGARVRFVCADEVNECDVGLSFLVIAAYNVDEATCERLHAYAQRANVVLCCTDRPRSSNAAMTAIAKSGPVRIAISTAGAAPGIAKALRKAFERAMDERFEHFVQRVADVRAGLQRSKPGPANARERISAMRNAVRGFTIHVDFGYPPWHGDP